MATNRSRRLRKKLCVDEFQELGFEVDFSYKDGLDNAAIETFIMQFLEQAVAANGLDYVGTEEFGLVCLDKRGSVEQAQRDAVEGWLTGRDELKSFTVTPLLDVWYPDKPINQPAS